MKDFKPLLAKALAFARERFLAAKLRFVRLSGRAKIVVCAGAFIALCGSCVVLASIGKTPAEDSLKDVRVVKIGEARGAASESLSSYPGEVRAFTKVNLFFRVGGPIVEMNFKVGDKVAKGQVLMRIDPRDFERKVAATKSQVAQEEAKLAAMKNGDRPEDLEIAKKELAAATARFEKAQFDFKRAERLYESDVYSKAQYDEAKSSFVVAESEFSAYKERLAKSKLGSRKEDIDAEEASLAAVKTQLKIAEDALADTVLAAPFDGIVTKRSLEKHEMAQAFSPVMTVQDIGLVKIGVDVPETCVSSLSELRGKRFSVKFSSRPGRLYESVLEEFDSDADPVTRTYALTMFMRQPEDFAILPGMTAEVSGEYKSFHATKEFEGVIVPSSAVVREPGLGKDLVWQLAADGSSVVKRFVESKELVGSAELRVKGLAPGSRIVVAGGQFLVEGMRVKPLDFHKEADAK